ncbi:RidA family protein [Bacteroidetes bacterium endosymbiont of Geopemphigus sp.]|uniref:RidA family protein n=1 Tax=Bacteroidetes bacterium endosymbiont of Geopemphigus sp. TaxID=2047937 RepID=UPI000CD0BCEE|nr:RidA family protein [Bacteroidetes bacterium endosymbiont of Geopemphigus sp.]
MKKIISPTNAPKPIGPYSGAILVEGFLYVSGQIPVDPSSGKIVSDNIKDQTLQVMKNLKYYLQCAEMNFENVIKTSIFIKDMNDFSKINEVYGNFFNESNYPARETIEVSRLPKDAHVEISLIAHSSKAKNTTS